jgi:hypothetical protein
MRQVMTDKEIARTIHRLHSSLKDKVIEENNRLKDRVMTLECNQQMIMHDLRRCIDELLKVKQALLMR